MLNSGVFILFFSSVTCFAQGESAFAKFTVQQDRVRTIIEADEQGRGELAAFVTSYGDGSRAFISTRGGRLSIQCNSQPEIVHCKFTITHSESVVYKVGSFMHYIIARENLPNVQYRGSINYGVTNKVGQAFLFKLNSQQLQVSFLKY